MKRKLLNSSLAVLLLLFLTASTTLTLASEIETGSIGIILNEYGRLRVHAPTTNDSRQIDRSSLLVASNDTSVFDYHNDAGTADTTRLVESPAHSDFEMWGSFDNSWSELPPDVKNEVRVYGWQGGAYVVVRFRVTNLASSLINALVGLEFIPQLDGQYGLETIEFVPAEQLMAIFSGASTHVGYKFLSGPMTSAHTFDWYDGYSDVESDYYSWLSYGAYDTVFTSLSTEGTVTVMAQDPVNIDAGVYTDLWVGISVGSDMATMISNMDSAQTKFESLIVSSIDNQPLQTVRSFTLDQNYPNPFNPETKINFSLGKVEKTTLKVYNLLGEEVATLVDRELPAGEHRIQFDGADLPSGIYIYTLQAGNQLMSKKMVMLK